MRYVPLCIHTFPIAAPYRIMKEELFCEKYQSYDEIQNVPDRLRWCRLHLDLLQREVAEQIGITKAAYMDMENGAVEYIEKEILDKLAGLYGVPVVDFIDGYHRFIYEGQGRQIQEYRLKLGLDLKKFASLLGTYSSCVRLWESEQKKVSRKTWEKYFKDRV